MTEASAATATAQSVPCLRMTPLSSECLWGFWGAVIVVGILALLHTALFLAAARAAGGRRPVVFLDMIVTGDDNRYSLSRLQVYLWTVVVVVGFSALTLATGRFATIPGNVLLLLGVNLGAAVAATAITTAKNGRAQTATLATIVPPLPAPPAPAPPATPPKFFRDIFCESGMPGSLDLPRAQMFLWTVITLITYVTLFIRGFAPTLNGAPVLPDVPTEMVLLMGVSQGAYLGAKAAK